MGLARYGPDVLKWGQLGEWEPHWMPPLPWNPVQANVHMVLSATGLYFEYPYFLVSNAG